jgi:hypothetical protein
MISTSRLFALGMIPIKIEDWQMESTIIQAFFKTAEEGTTSLILIVSKN